jgi:hypothetical protein
MFLSDLAFSVYMVFWLNVQVTIFFQTLLQICITAIVRNIYNIFRKTIDLAQSLLR